MTLTARYFSHPFKEEDKDKTQKEIKKLFGLKGLNVGKFESVSFEFMYWRKANAIHKFFVDNVQSGEDNCNEYYVDTDILRELLNIINKILIDKSKAKELLPCQGGFFFGGVEYDDYYFETLKDTKNRLEYLFDNLDKFKRVWFDYRSSW